MRSFLAGACGDWCGKCPHYPEECPGCGLGHRDCFFLNCLKSRLLEHCGQCQEFPCSRLSAFVPDDSPGYPPGYHIKNLERRNQIPLKEWLKEQEEYWKSLKR